MMASSKAAVEESVNEQNLQDEMADALAEAHEEWSVDIDEVSGQLVIEVERKEFHPDGATATALALDHPKKPGWRVLTPGNSKDRWKATYESGIVAADVLADLTHIFEARRTMKCKHPSKQRIQSYYAVETAFLDKLKRHE